MKQKTKAASRQIWTVVGVFAGVLNYAQVGINTLNPKSALHIEASNTNSPTATDGILLPRVTSLPTTGLIKGQLLFLDTTASTSGFYLWNGTEWDYLVKNNLNRTIDESILSISGQETTTTYTTTYNEQNLLFNQILGSSSTGFSTSSNTITIGKSGTYLINITSSLKTNAPIGRRSTFRYTLKHTTTNSSNVLVTNSVANATSSIPNEKITATNISFSHIVTLKQGDKLYVTRQKLTDSGNSDNVEFIPFGTNSLRLTFLQ